MEEFSNSFFYSSLTLKMLIIKSVIALAGSYILTFISIPKIIRISYRKNLISLPQSRSSHFRATPNLGGAAMFYAILIMSSVTAFQLYYEYVFLLSSIIILFFVGMMDDILVVRPNKKFYAQILTAILISVGSKIRVGSFFGIFGIETLPYWISILFTIIVFIFLINSFNLIDGIDGLASYIAIISSCAFIFSFWRLGPINYPLVILSFCIIGSLLAFLRFNFSTDYKIFMGDTGSMIIGFLLSFMAIRFLNLFILQFHGRYIYHLRSAPAIAISIFIIPIIDTISVFIIRLYNGKSPFKADKNHMHHNYLKLGLTHKQVALILSSEHLLILIVTYLLRHINVYWLLITIFGMGLIFLILPFMILQSRKR